MQLRDRKKSILNQNPLEVAEIHKKCRENRISYTNTVGQKRKKAADRSAGLRETKAMKEIKKDKEKIKRLLAMLGDS